MSDKTKPTFILGVGAQKAGTTWLHSALNDRDDVDMGFRKEYHIWDAKFHSELFGKFVASPPRKGERADRALRRAMQVYPKAYERYFRGLITKKIRATGDITPTYNALGAEQYGEIRARLEAARFDVKVVFLMRDPVDRVWSALRMMRRDHKGEEMTDAQFMEMCRERYLRPGSLARTRYDETVASLEKAFDEDQLYYGFYESMFEPGNVKAVSDHLGLDLSGYDTGKRVNASPSAPIPDDFAAELRALYQPVYDFCFERFPETKTLWA